eukprot:scaffold16735_cov33-Tisochrysis_lutea.AAC.5
MVAGGQPSSISLLENVMKECEEEASLPPDVVRSVRATGLVSYRCEALTISRGACHNWRRTDSCRACNRAKLHAAALRQFE